MTPAPVRRPRPWQTENTRALIVATAVVLIRDGGEGAVTMPAVAARIGIAERTVYRHFESRDALLQAAWQRIQGGTEPERYQLTVDELVARPRRLFPRCDVSRELARAMVYSSVALENRKRTNEPRQEMMLRCVRTALAEFDDEGTARRRAAIIDLLSSTYAWEFLTQFWDFDGAEAGQAASEAMAVILGLQRAGWD